MGRPPRAGVDLAAVDGAVLDTDGVITDTARVHAAAWRRAFDELLRERGRQSGTVLPPFDVESDYPRFVDGRSRADGARGFLRSRRITLPEGGGPGAAGPGSETLGSLLDRKARYFLDEIGTHGVQAFPGTVRLLRELRRHGTGIAAASASRSCGPVLRAAGVDDLVDVRVDGLDADRLGLPGKPDPALFLEAARRLGVPPGRCALFEDAVVGVEAGLRGGFGTVVGVDRHGSLRGSMLAAGAHLVVGDLAEVTLVDATRRGRSQGEGPRGA
ncbi:HAD family hydrolase [Promicromonospora sp. NPDC057488]|uniref:HAD family hydrolase n=1 Tax=Promicromonospora sp. NPDC057488 TaxID=3346147 RepID=UPI00366D3D23